MTTPTPLEQRLSAALAARTEQVQPETLSAAAAPAAVVPLHRRRLAILATVGLAAASVVTVAVVASTTGDDSVSPAPAGPVTVSPSTPVSTPVLPPVSPSEGVDPQPVHDWDPKGLPDPIDYADRAYLGIGGIGAFTYRGSKIRVQIEGPPAARNLADGEGALKVTVNGRTSRVPLPAGSYVLKPNAVELGGGATGVVVASPISSCLVYALIDGELDRAEPIADTVPLGSNFDGPGQRYDSFIDDAGRLNTLVPVRDARADARFRYALYSWTASSGPAPVLIPTSRGEICVDEDAGEYGRC